MAHRGLKNSLCASLLSLSCSYGVWAVEPEGLSNETVQLWAGDREAEPTQGDVEGAVKEELRKEGAPDPVSTKRALKKKDLARKTPSGMTGNAAVVSIRGGAAFNAFAGSQKAKDGFVFKAGTEAAAQAGPTTTVSRESRKHFAFQDSKIEFQVLKKIDPAKNLAWRLNIALSADKTVVAPKFVRQAYITLLSNYATVHLGNYVGPEESMALSGGSVLGDVGLYGFSNLEKFAPGTYGVRTDTALIGNTAESTKVTIFSPRWKGFMLGASYTPSTAHYGNASLNTRSASGWGGPASPYTVNNFEGGLTYIGFIQPDLKVSLSVTGIVAQARPETSNVPVGQSLQRRSVRSVAFGGVVNYKAFAFGAEYAYNGRSLEFATDRAGVTPVPGGPALDYTAQSAQAPRWFNVGLSYLYQNTKFALGYMRSMRKTGFKNTRAKANIYNASVTYQKIPGLDFYVEGFLYKTKNDMALYEGKLLAQSLPTGSATAPIVTNQKANVLVLGMKVSF